MLNSYCGENLDFNTRSSISSSCSSGSGSSSSGGNNNNDDDDDDDDNNNNNRYRLIDVGILGDRNVIKKEAEMILKYKDLTIEIQPMWNVKTKVIPVIIRATGTTSKSFRKYVSNIPG